MEDLGYLERIFSLLQCIHVDATVTHSSPYVHIQNDNKKHPYVERVFELLTEHPQNFPALSV